MYDTRARFPVPPAQSRLMRCLWTLLFAVLFLTIGTSSLPAWGAAGAWSENEHGRLRLISESEGLKGKGEQRAGLHFELAEGWKTYWRSPGDAGYPLTIDWSASENLAAVEMDWPVPHRFTLFRLDTFGYDKEVVFPLRLQAEDPDKALHLEAEVDYLLCEE